MTEFKRYGVYAAPAAESALARMGAAWLGWDAAAGREAEHPVIAGLDAARLTQTPRKYGLHGTLKPPFALAEGRDRAGLEAAVEALAGKMAAFPGPRLSVASIGRFIAIVPETPCDDLKALAASCVSELDAFRAPPSEAELARRRAAGLTAAQEEMLQRWGYPYVMEEFRFHLTLTGQVAEAEREAVRDALATHFAPALETPAPVEDVALFGEAPDGRFHIIRRFPFGR